jgi:molecular chaperone DnaK (HSP70)
MTLIAIDFGTSNTVVCTFNQALQAAETLVFPFSHRYLGGPPLVPSAVHIDPARGAAVGRDARNRSDRSRLFEFFKRDLAQQFEPAPRSVGDELYPPQRVGEIFLSSLMQAVQVQKIQPTKLVLTAPVGAYEHYLHWLQSQMEQFGVSECAIVDESTAAALGYAIDQAGTLVLVFDLGGGTLDLSLVRTTRVQAHLPVQQAEVLAKSDRPWACGGIDIDTWIAELALERMGLNRINISTGEWQNLLEIAELVKVRLSSHEQASESWFNEETFDTWEISLSRSEFEDLLERRGFLGRLRMTTDEVLERAFARGISKRDIEAVVLVGGTSLIPAVQKQIASVFGPERLHMGRAFEAVAHGALYLDRYSRIDDHLRHTYAIRLWDPYLRTHTYYPIFESGSEYPAMSSPLILQANATGQSSVNLVVGELSTDETTEVYYDNDGMLRIRFSSADTSFRALGSRGEISFPLSPPGFTAVDRLEVIFHLSASRMLLASVRDLLTNTLIFQEHTLTQLR